MSGAPQIKDLTADILSGIVDGVAVTDATGQLLIWNRAIEEMTGIMITEALGKDVKIVLAEDPAVVSLIEKTFSSGRTYSDYEAELHARNGHALPVGLVTAVLPDVAGSPLGVILTIRDQTALRDLKERMRRADRLAAIGQIAAGIAHEIKNPLVGIRGAAQLMKSDIKGDRLLFEGKSSLSPFLEYVDVILKESDRLNSVLEGILDFTRLKPHERRKCNVHSILDRALVLNEENARQHGIVLSRQYDPSLPELIGNGDQILQIFLNLVKNAVEAMPDGGRLTVVTRMSDLFTSVQADGRKHRLMVVKVSDTGAGIRDEDLASIFTPFFTTKDRGVGLGLALSYQIAQEHLGAIRVESKDGEGATFSVYLPLAE